MIRWRQFVPYPQSMSHIKEYIGTSILIPPDAREAMIVKEVHTTMEEEILCFMETYAPMEKEILGQVNKELEVLNMQIKNYLRKQEIQLREQELDEVEQEIAYL